jgi:hypothetical protein
MTNKLPFTVLPLINPGHSSGVLTVSSTINLAKGATCFLSADGIEAKQLVVDEVMSTTKIAVKDPQKLGNIRFDCSAFVLEKKPKLTQPEQVNHNSSHDHAMMFSSQREQALLNTVTFLKSRVDAIEMVVVKGLPFSFKRALMKSGWVLGSAVVGALTGLLLHNWM